MLHELRAWMSIANLGGELAYWSTPTRKEVDFVWTRGKTAVGIEVKASKTWRPEFGVPLREMESEGVVQRAFGVYLGKERLKLGNALVLPLVEFLRDLHAGKVLWRKT